jgi:hypothetical protein
MTKIVNLTPHTINIAGHTPIMPSGEIARVNFQIIQSGEINGIPVMETIAHGISGLPPKTNNTVYVVPSMVRQYFPSRRDLVSPAKLLRNNIGVVVGCVGFEINPEHGNINC